MMNDRGGEEVGFGADSASRSWKESMYMDKVHPSLTATFLVPFWLFVFVGVREQEAASQLRDNTRPREYATLPYREMARAKRTGSTFDLFKSKLHTAHSLCLSPPPNPPSAAIRTEFQVST